MNIRLTYKILIRSFKSQSLVNRVTLLLSMSGIMIGVACLIVAMAVVSGVQNFIQESVTDLTGHFMILSRSGDLDLETVRERLASVTPVTALTPFLSSQGVIVKKGQISGVMIHGLELNSIHEVLNLKNRMLSGNFNLEPGVRPRVIIGKELARSLGINLGETVNIVVPIMDSVDTGQFRPTRSQFEVSGIIDFGKYDYNDKVVLTDLSSVQSLTQIGKNFFGIYAKVESADIAKAKSIAVSDSLGIDFKVRSWWDMNQNFFTAAELEKIVIFIVVLSIVVVASLNISSALYVSVLRKYFDIAILKTLGATESFLIRIFLLQGALIAILSILAGVVLGLFGAWIVGNTRILYVPGRIYNFDHLPIQIHAVDIFWIIGVSFFICLISSWLPARKGAKQKPMEGLKYESA